MTTKNIMAIDPGASGGIAIFSQAEKLFQSVAAVAMPDDVEQMRSVKDFSELDGEKVCYMEIVSGYIKGSEAPGSAMFNFGDGWGFLRGLLAAYKIKLVLVRPQKWQVGIMGAADKAGHKRALKEHAQRIFPDQKVTLKTADALCILDYAMKEERITGPDTESRKQAHAINKSVPLVATVDLPLKEQHKLAQAWAASVGHPIKDRKDPAYSAMFNYWLSRIAPQVIG